MPGLIVPSPLLAVRDDGAMPGLRVPSPLAAVRDDGTMPGLIVPSPPLAVRDDGAGGEKPVSGALRAPITYYFFAQSRHPEVSPRAEPRDPDNFFLHRTVIPTTPT